MQLPLLFTFYVVAAALLVYLHSRIAISAAGAVAVYVVPHLMLIPCRDTPRLVAAATYTAFAVIFLRYPLLYRKFATGFRHHAEGHNIPDSPLPPPRGISAGRLRCVEHIQSDALTMDQHQSNTCMAHALSGAMQFIGWKARASGSPNLPNTDDISQRIESSPTFAAFAEQFCGAEKSVSACGASVEAVFYTPWKDKPLRVNASPSPSWCVAGNSTGDACELSSAFWTPGGYTMAYWRKEHVQDTDADKIAVTGAVPKAGTLKYRKQLTYETARALLGYGPFVAMVNSAAVQKRGKLASSEVYTDAVLADADHAVMCYHAEEDAEGRLVYRFKNSWGKNCWELLVVEAGNNAAGAENSGVLWFAEETAVNDIPKS